VVSSPPVAGSNALAETATASGATVAVYGVLSRSDFTCQEGAVGLDITVELASPISPGWQKPLGQLKEAILPEQLPADTELIRLPILLTIRWRYQPCEWRRNLSDAWQFLPMKRVRFRLMPCHRNHCRKAEKRSQRRNNPSP
jgi:hypothetical protein